MLVVAFVLFQGSAFGLTSIIRPVITAEFLGRRNFGVVSGLIALPYLSATARRADRRRVRVAGAVAMIGSSSSRWARRASGSSFLLLAAAINRPGEPPAGADRSGAGS